MAFQPAMLRALVAAPAMLPSLLGLRMEAFKLQHLRSGLPLLGNESRRGDLLQKLLSHVVFPPSVAVRRMPGRGQPFWKCSFLACAV